MTRPFQKLRERFMVEEAARQLGAVWSLGPDRESPDFLITEALQHFGMEVHEVFSGKKIRAGSERKKREGETQQIIDRVRRKFERSERISLNVSIRGRVSDESLDELLTYLIRVDFAGKQVGYSTRVVTCSGLRVQVTKGFRAEWFSVDDRVGWVDTDAERHIAAALNKKSERLPYYRAVNPDIRLLLYTDQIHNSGKLRLSQEVHINTQEFRFVYFLPYPGPFVVFDSAYNTA